MDPVVSYASVIVPEINNQLIAAGAGATTKYTSVTGLSHSPPPASYMCGCYTFIEGHVATGISPEPEQKNELFLYPNPTGGILNLNSNAFMPIAMVMTTEEIEIYNIMGECVHKQTMTSSSLQIDVSALPSGLYFLRMKDHPEVVQKFIRK